MTAYNYRVQGLPWHGSGSHLRVHVPPVPGHVLHGEAAGGAGVQALGQHVLVAGQVQEVAAGGNVRPVPTVVNVLGTMR